MRTNTVSYTHLDVYKRQEIEIPSIKADEVLIRHTHIGVNFIDTYFPVSYTHLDVYKRQN